MRRSRLKDIGPSPELNLIPSSRDMAVREHYPLWPLLGVVAGFFRVLTAPIRWIIENDAGHRRGGLRIAKDFRQAQASLWLRR